MVFAVVSVGRNGEKSFPREHAKSVANISEVLIWQVCVIQVTVQKSVLQLAMVTMVILSWNLFHVDYTGTFFRLEALWYWLCNTLLYTLSVAIHHTVLEKYARLPKCRVEVHPIFSCINALWSMSQLINDSKWLTWQQQMNTNKNVRCFCNNMTSGWILAIHLLPGRKKNWNPILVAFYVCEQYWWQTILPLGCRTIHRCHHSRAEAQQPIRQESMLQSENNSTQEVLCATKQWHHRAAWECQCSRWVTFASDKNCQVVLKCTWRESALHILSL